MNRTTSLPTSLTTSARVTKSPARLDIFTGSPARNSRTIWTSFTSRSTRPSVSALTAAWTRLTVPAWSAPQMLTRWSAFAPSGMVSGVRAEICPAAVRLLHRPVLVVAELRSSGTASARPAPTRHAGRGSWAARARLRRRDLCHAAPPSPASTAPASGASASDAKISWWMPSRPRS